MRVGSYEVLGELGRGAMGSVLRARATDGRIVAVKVLITPSPDRLARFDREKRLIGEFGEAEGFVPLLDAGVEGTRPYLVMPFCAGGTLRQKIERGPFDLEAAVALGVSLARAAGRAHARGIVHRDLKPENVLYTATGRPLVADLGLAKHFETEAARSGLSVQLSVAGEMRGTVGYMSPEQLTDAKSAGPPADVFALGAILHECLTGEPVFAGDTALVVMQKIMDGDVTPIETIPVPRWLQEVLDRALATDPAERFPDGEALAVALTERKEAPRSRLPLALLFALVLVAAGLVAFLVTRPAPRAAVAERSPLEAALATLATGDAALVPGAQRTVLGLARGPQGDATAAALDSAVAAAPAALELHRVRALVARQRSAPLAADDLAAVATSSTARDADDLAAHALRYGLVGPGTAAAARALHAAHKESSAAAELHGVAVFLSRDLAARGEAAAALRAAHPPPGKGQDLLRLLDLVDALCVELDRPEEPKNGSVVTASRRTADTLHVVAQERELVPAFEAILLPLTRVARAEWGLHPIGDPGQQWRMEAVKTVLASAYDILPPTLFILYERLAKNPGDTATLEQERRWVEKLDVAARALAQEDPLLACEAYEIAACHAERWFVAPSDPALTAFARDRFARAEALVARVRARPMTDSEALCTGYVLHECRKGLGEIADNEVRALDGEPWIKGSEASMAFRRQALELARTVPGINFLAEDDAQAIVKLALRIDRLDEAADLLGDITEGRSLRAHLLRKKGDPEGAIALASTVQALLPHKGLTPDALAVMAEAAADLGRFDEARGYLAKLAVAEGEQKVFSDAFRSPAVAAYVESRRAARAQGSPPDSR
jgi:tetratricopeptide (TPR) repeat protein